MLCEKPEPAFGGEESKTGGLCHRASLDGWSPHSSAYNCHFLSHKSQKNYLYIWSER